MVAGSNLIHDRNYLCLRSLSFANWLWSVITPILKLNTVCDVLDISTKYTCFAQAHAHIDIPCASTWAKICRVYHIYQT